MEAIKASSIIRSQAESYYDSSFPANRHAVGYSQPPKVGFNGQVEQIEVISKNLNRAKKVESRLPKVNDPAKARYKDVERFPRRARFLAKKNAIAESAAKEVIKTDAQKLDSQLNATLGMIHKYISPTVTKATQSLKSVSSEWLMKFSKHPKLAFAAGSVIGGVTAFNLVRGAFSRKDNNELAIPKYYRRGYDLINEYTSDFGSPVKAAVITRALIPYVSSTRRGMIKSVNSVTKSNIALAAHDNAIGHTRY
jgi:hypothetical protein